MTVIKDRAGARTDEVFGGALLSATAVLTLVFIMHHPSVSAHHDFAEAAADIRAVGQMDRIVHGGLMVIYGAQALGFYVFSRAAGFRNPGVAGGFLAFMVGVGVMLIPATLDGFVTPDLLEACRRATGGCSASDATALRLMALMIQDFTKVALVAVSIGTAGWSFALLTRRELPSRIAGGMGLICAGVLLSVIIFSDVYLRPDNLMGLIAPQVVWSVVAAAVLMFGDLRALPINGSADTSSTPQN